MRNIYDLEFSLFSMKRDKDTWKQFCPKRLITFINYVSIYPLCTTCKAKRMLDTLSFQKTKFSYTFLLK